MRVDLVQKAALLGKARIMKKNRGDLRLRDIADSRSYWLNPLVHGLITNKKAK